MDTAELSRPQFAERRKPLLTWQFIVVMVPGLMLFYALSMVPIARMYRSTTGVITWHEQAMRSFYAPLLSFVDSNDTARIVTENYNAICAYVIPKGPVRSKMTWWRENQFNKLVDNFDKIPDKTNVEVTQPKLEEMSALTEEP